jgi:hypothetical protein
VAECEDNTGLPFDVPVEVRRDTGRGGLGFAVRVAVVPAFPVWVFLSPEAFLSSGLLVGLGEAVKKMSAAMITKPCS